LEWSGNDSLNKNNCCWNNRFEDNVWLNSFLTEYRQMKDTGNQKWHKDIKLNLNVNKIFSEAPFSAKIFPNFASQS
jgi:hypothetical protein